MRTRRPTTPGKWLWPERPSLLADHYDAFTKKHFDKLQSALDVDEDALREALDELTRLNPKPGNAGSESSRVVHHVIPDFLLSVDGEDVVFQLNGRNAPELRVSRTYREMMDTYAQGGKQDKATKEALTFVKQKVDAAKWFVDAIVQRQKDVDPNHASHRGPSTRVLSQWGRGGFEAHDFEGHRRPHRDGHQHGVSGGEQQVRSDPLRHVVVEIVLFEGITTDSGEEVSSREVKKILKDAISEEDKRKPLSDEKLGVLLNAKGYNIARRTVAKYREQLGIPVARLRKEL